MSKVKAGAAEISIVASDKTAPAFKTVNENFDQFSKNLSTFENNIKPFQEIMKGGVAAGGLATGLGALTSSASIFSSSLQNASGSLGQLSGAAQDSSGPLGIVSNILNSEGFTGAAAKMTAIATGAMAAFAAIKQLAVSWSALRTIYFAVNGAVYAHAAAQTASMAATTAAAATTTAAATATAAGTVATVGQTAALGWYSWACSAAAVATNFLTASLGLNPFTVWLVAIGAIVAGLAALGYGIYAFCQSGKEKTKTLREISEEANKTAEANKKMADSIKTSNDLIAAKYERLKQLSKKDYLSKDELKEAQDVSVDMRMDYGVKGGYSDEEGWKDFTSVDDLRMKIAAEAKIRNNLYAQLRALQAADNGALTKEEAMDNRKRQNEIELELIKMRIEAEKEIEEHAKKRAETEEAAAKAVLEAQKAKEQVISRGLELQKSLQREIDDQDKTALEKELPDLFGELYEDMTPNDTIDHKIEISDSFNGFQAGGKRVDLLHEIKWWNETSVTANLPPLWCGTASTGDNPTFSDDEKLKTRTRVHLRWFHQYNAWLVVGHDCCDHATGSGRDE